MFQTGQKIGPYILERALGEGSYGVVWLAEERTGLIQRQVALKLPKDADPDIEAIRREAEVWLRAGKHHNVVQVLHADIYDGQVAIASEYIPGGSLHDRLKREMGKPADVEAAVEMTRGILAGLQHLHSIPPKPLVHRDLKPGNVLLRGDTPLLTDFGLSRAFSSTAFTQAGGTPGYMPPEAFDDRFSPQTDIWAAGVTLYRMLKGELPFPQRDLSALIGAILHKEPEPLPDWVPYPIAAVVFQALMKDPSHRFASAEEMRAALDDSLRTGTWASAVPATRLPPIPPLPSADTLPMFDIPAHAADQFPIPATPDLPAWAIDDRANTPALPMPAAGPANVPALAAEQRRMRHRAMEIAAAYKVPEAELDGHLAAMPPVSVAMAPQVPAPPIQERRKEGDSEALTAIPEQPPQTAGLTGRVDSLLRYLSRDTARFCGTLIASVPFWGLLGILERLLEQSQLISSLPGVLLIAGFMSWLFARLAWHRFYRLPEAKRKSTAIQYAVLGLFSGTVLPVIVVTFLVAISGATSDTPAEVPHAETPRIEGEKPSP